MSDRDPQTASWHLDKRVNISIIFAIIMQTIAGSYWVGVVSQRVAQTETWITANSLGQARLAVLESQMNDIRATLNRIEGRLDGNKPIPQSAPEGPPATFFFDGDLLRYGGPHLP